MTTGRSWRPGYTGGRSPGSGPADLGACLGLGGRRFRTPSLSTFRGRINSIGTGEEDDVDGRLWFARKGARCKVGVSIMGVSSLRAMSRFEYRHAVYGNRGRSRHRILVASDSDRKTAQCV